jgi:beta-glucanase (GH16 family)
VNGKLLTKTLIKIAGIVFAAGFTAATVLAANVLSNPGFEFDPAGETMSVGGWTPYGGNVYSETSQTLAHGGTNYLKVFQAFNGHTNYTGVYQDYISSPGATYAADGWAYTSSGDVLAGQNAAWVEVTFRDATTNVIGLYRTFLITTNAITSGAFPTNAWIHLPITNQYDPILMVVTNTPTSLTAPAGTVFMRYQVVFRGDAKSSGGSVYFDDLNLNQISGLPYGDMNIVWDDEFDGNSIKTNIWTFDLGNGGSNPGWGNNELEYYTSRTNNAFVANGYLHIVARNESTNGFNYTSARMKSEGLFSTEFGRLEWRAQLPAGVGCWPALWMLGTNITSIGWPGCGEVDVVENNGTNLLVVQGSLHSGSDETAVYNFTDGNSTTNFHIYTLDWTTNAFLYYVDGHLYEIQTNWGSSTSNPYPYPFNQPFFLLMNLAIGGNYVGNPSTAAINAGTVFPAQMLVDYVRIYRETGPLAITVSQIGSNLLLSWPSNIICHLQTKGNLSAFGTGTNWISVTTTNGQIQISPTNGAGFYRLVSP